MATAAYETEKNPKGDDVSVLGSEKQGHEGSFDDDSIVEGSEGVTQREFTTLRLVPDKINFSSWLVIIVEFAERCVRMFISPRHIIEPCSDGRIMEPSMFSTMLVVLLLWTIFNHIDCCTVRSCAIASRLS